MKKFKEIIQNIAKNDLILIWVVTFLLVIALLIVTIIINKDNAEETEKKEIPEIKTEKDTVEDFSFDYSRSDEFSIFELNKNDVKALEDNYKALSKEIKIYNEIDKNYTDNIRQFAVDAGLADGEILTKYSSIWSKDHNRIVYDIQEARLFFEFEKPVKIILGGTLNSKSSQQEYELYFNDFISRYLNSNIKLSNFALKEGALTFFKKNYWIKTIRAERTHDNFTIYTDDSASVSNYLIFDENGNLMRGNITIAEFEIDEEASKNVDRKYFVIKPEELDSYILNKDYPRVQYSYEYNLIGGDYTPENESSDYLDYTREGAYKLPTPEICNVENVDLAYYKPVGEDIFPVYKVDCVGEADYLEGIYEIKSVLFLKAILPK